MMRTKPLRGQVADAPAIKRSAKSGLERTDFVCLAKNGWGDGLNSYAHTMAWYREHIYVGTSRATLAMVKVNVPPPALTHWPVNAPDNVYDLDRRAVIWRFDPRRSYWEKVFVSPMVEGVQGDIVARDIGYRGSAVFKGQDDPEAALYVCTWSSSKGQPPIIMRTRNGLVLEQLPRPLWGNQVNTFRTLVPFKDCLFTTPTGSTQGYGQAQECVGSRPVVYVSDHPGAGIWREANVPGFGDADNMTIFEMATFNDHLYAGTINPVSGFLIWKTRAEGEPPYHWQKVVTDGAYRGKLNQVAVSMCPFNGALYIGSGIVNGGYDRRYKIGPAASEMIRVHADDTWDLIVGEARLTPVGLKYPLSDQGAGFDNFFNGYFWRMAVHDGHLYLGTYKWNQLLPYMPIHDWPDAMQFLLEARGVEDLIHSSGGFDLWCTRDGVEWEAVTRTGFDNPYNWGVRTMVSTAFGLFIGTANPFGPEIAIKKNGGWMYQKNSQGGLEVWLGCKAPRTAGMPAL